MTGRVVIASREAIRPGEGIHPGLLRSARNDVARSQRCGLLAMTGGLNP
ncbi:MAG: hypothetical protein LBT00_04400 [Spirochaetaceae bacterium]|nr:hypothetical protein [Spirochaetaceae bacterium]